MQTKALTTTLLVLLASVRNATAQGGPQQPSNYNQIRTAHAVLGSLAWVIFFPLGAIIIRFLSSPHAWLIHAFINVFAWAMFIVAAGLGIWMSLVSQQLNSYHPIIGLVLLALVSIQPIGGLLHHYLWAKRNKSEFVAMYHIWMGRILITLGMINGGLGLLYSGNATRGEQIAYGVVAGIIWVSWIAIAIGVPGKRGNEIPGTINSSKRASYEGNRSALGDSSERGSEMGSQERIGITVNFRQ